METKATNVKLTVDYTCPNCGKKFQNVEMPFDYLNAFSILSGRSDVDDGWGIEKTFNRCPECKTIIALKFTKIILDIH